MPDKTDLETAYALVREQETALIKAIDEIAVDYLGKLAALVDAQPSGAEHGVAGQYLARVAGATMAVFGFDLTNMRAMYGVVPEATTEPPAPTPEPA